MKARVDRPLCIGAGTCVASAPAVFELDAEGKAVMIRTDGTKSSDETDLTQMNNTTPENVLEAAKVCPTGAIVVSDDEGKQIYP